MLGCKRKHASSNSAATMRRIEIGLSQHGGHGNAKIRLENQGFKEVLWRE